MLADAHILGRTIKHSKKVVLIKVKRISFGKRNTSRRYTRGMSGDAGSILFIRVEVMWPFAF